MRAKTDIKVPRATNEAVKERIDIYGPWHTVSAFKQRPFMKLFHPHEDVHQLLYARRRAREQIC